jgi:PKD repeat protein
MYSTEGSYSINLTVTNAAGSDSEVKTNFVTVNPAPVAPVAAFTNSTVTPRSGTAPLTVMFTDQSTGTAPLTYAWDFDNNGSTDSTEQSPSHVYASAGTYSVNLTVTNSAGNNSVLRTDYITASSPVSPIAGFTGTPQSGPAPLAVSFTDTSTGDITSRSWQYKNATADWTQFSTILNPSYTFPVGTYDIRLNVTGPGGSNTRTENGYITVES